MFYYLYEIRNKINGMIYVGVHKTKDLNDGYMGSGKILRHAIKKNGIENFDKTILEIFETSEAMFCREKEIVNDEFLLREDTYNLRRGGTGGFDYINSSGISKFAGKNHQHSNREKMGHPGNTYAKGNTNGRNNKGMKRDKRECPYCHKLCSVNMYPRYHGENCKKNAAKAFIDA